MKGGTMTYDEAKVRAVELRKEGMGLKQIGRTLAQEGYRSKKTKKALLGCSVSRLLKDSGYKPDGKKVRKVRRKRSERPPGPQSATLRLLVDVRTNPDFNRAEREKLTDQILGVVR